MPLLTPNDATLLERLEKINTPEIAPWAISNVTLTQGKELIEEAHNFLKRTENLEKSPFFEDEFERIIIESMRKKIPSLISEIQNLIDTPELSKLYGWGMFRTQSPQSVADRSSPAKNT